MQTLSLAVLKKRLHTLPVASSAIGIAGIVMAVGILAPDMIFSQEKTNDSPTDRDGPKLLDTTLSLQEVVKGLHFPTSMAFLDANNILVLQKNDGQVRLVSYGKLIEKPLLQLPVLSDAEQGLLGIAITNGSSPTNNEVFLYLTENVTDDDDNNKNNKSNKNQKTVATNRIYNYRYDWNQRTLVDGRLLLSLSGGPGPYHNGGKIAIGPDGYLYAVTGDTTDSVSVLGNHRPDIDGKPADDRSVIIRVDPKTGKAPTDNPFYRIKGLEKVYAYGIRNSFGIDFDPISNTLWMTENGPNAYDEINVVRPGFNSGWDRLSGPIAKSNSTIDDLVIFQGAKYVDPVFSWHVPVGVTDIEFYQSDKLGKKYKDNIFVGDVNNGNLYFFTLNHNRTRLDFGGDGQLQRQQNQVQDLVADPVLDKENTTSILDGEPLSSITIGKGFSAVTDIETGPDGFLYVLSYLDGRIYRVVADMTSTIPQPNNNATSGQTKHSVHD